MRKSAKVSVEGEDGSGLVPSFLFWLLLHLVEVLEGRTSIQQSRYHRCLAAANSANVAALP